jgi:hypothetical protein
MFAVGEAAALVLAAVLAGRWEATREGIWLGASATVASGWLAWVLL